MARTARVKLSGKGVADYHLISRTNDKRFLFQKGGIKTQLADALKRSAEFCGVRVLAYTVMDNHFHIVVRVTRTGVPVAEAELIRRVRILKGEKAAEELAEKWEELHAAGYESMLEGEMNRLRVQMNDISAFIKVFKELFDRLYKKKREYTGSIWAGRFKSTLIENGRYLSTCIKYVIYNPIRAGIVTKVSDYRWSWCENEEKSEDCSGSVPDEWCLKKRPQIVSGRVYGGMEYVMRMAYGLGSCFYAKGMSAHGIVGLPDEAGTALLGWKLAGKEIA